MAVEDFNRRAVRGLERAQQASGIRSAEAFAGRLSERVGGSPDGSTYRRWVRGESVIPAWALIAAADESSLSPDELLEWVRSDAVEGELAGYAQRVELLERELLGLRREFSKAMEHLVEEGNASGDTLAQIVRVLEDANLWDGRRSESGQGRNEVAGGQGG